ncbi:MAG TPA: hypothetical protein VK752_17710 [Bryobacteraceae bacterium]|jgi:hypothetical protein|nr:hypothetical protein [Bryobacteraceae bacterium]
MWKAIYDKQQSGIPVGTPDNIDALQDLALKFAGSRRYAETVRAIVIENRHARLPFPIDLFLGDFDQRWGWYWEWCGPVWLGATADQLDQEGVPFHLV